MPNWLSNIVNAGTSPLVPKGAIRGLQEALYPGSSEPLPGEEDASFFTQLGQVPGAISDLAGTAMSNPIDVGRGFLSGAVEGVRGQTSPVGLAGMGGAGLLKGLNAARGGAGLIDDAVRTFDTVEDIPVPQRMPSMGDVDAVIGDAYRQMAKVPKATGQYRGPGAPTASTQGRLPAEFVPRGGERAYNAGRKPGF